MTKEDIIKSIIEIKDKTDKLITYKNIRCEFSVAKYSSKKNEIWHLLIDDKLITKKCPYLFTCICNTCSFKSTVCTTQFLRRIAGESVRCGLCKNQDETKRSNQSKYMLGEHIPKKIDKIETNDFSKIREESIRLFENTDDYFKTLFFNSHLTEFEYMRISKNLISIEDGKYTDKDNYEFWPVYKTNNQMLFTSVLYDKLNNKIFKANNPILRCDNCDNTWRSKSLEKFKNDIKIFCKDCSFVSKTFKLKSYKNLNNEKILYQSKLELKFISFCNDNKILVTNGPKIKYFFNGKNRTYKVDFQSGNKLIEIKDQHIWHKKELESGKWQAKETAARNYSKENSLEYSIITPVNWLEDLNKLIKI
jgi:hypothetical protein